VLAVEEFKPGAVKFSYNIYTRTVDIAAPPADPNRRIILEPTPGEN
jgi:hypothetical protein